MIDLLCHCRSGLAGWRDFHVHKSSPTRPPMAASDGLGGAGASDCFCAAPFAFLRHVNRKKRFTSTQ